MDSSVKNLLEAEREAQKIILEAQSKREEAFKAARTSAQMRINKEQQKFDEELQAQSMQVRAGHLS